LRDELGRRGLILSGATAGTALHRGPGALSEALEECRRVAALVAALDAPFLITLPAMFTDLYTGELLEPAELTSVQWKSLGEGHTELGRALLQEFGVRQMFHPHADAHVESAASIDRFLEVTDPASVSLCLDTGHIAYGGGDNRAVVAKHPSRIGYVHLKSVNPEVIARVRAEHISFADAVQLGAMVEPDGGEPEMPALLADLDSLGLPLWAIVEHDMYPAPAPTACGRHAHLRLLRRLRPPRSMRKDQKKGDVNPSKDLPGARPAPRGRTRVTTRSAGPRYPSLVHRL
jgi:inosose dehydratase